MGLILPDAGGKKTTKAWCPQRLYVLLTFSLLQGAERWNTNTRTQPVSPKRWRAISRRVVERVT